MLGQGGRQEQPGIVHQAVVVEGYLDGNYILDFAVAVNYTPRATVPLGFPIHVSTDRVGLSCPLAGRMETGNCRK